MKGRLSKVRLLVCGDSGTGKTALIKLLCKHSTGEQIPPTIGCYVDCGIFNGPTCRVLVEYIEVSGKCKDPGLIRMFLTLQPNGVIFMYKTENSRSLNNIRFWFNSFIETNNEPPESLSKDSTSYIRLEYQPENTYISSKKECIAVAFSCDSSHSTLQNVPIQISKLNCDHCYFSATCLPKEFISTFDSYLSRIIRSSAI